MRKLLVIGCMLLANTAGAQVEEFDHDVWDALLQENVRVIDGGRATQVDYDGMLEKRAELQMYLESLSAVARELFDSWDRDTQLAFLINVYNSWTVELILSRYPELQSIKDLGSLFRSPWKKEIVRLFGKKYSLDEIEHDLIRGSGRYNDPRIHFAVNCASVGCPALRPEAYRGEKLQQQLDSATALFLMDSTRNRLRGDTMELSSIFKWYREDFEKGWLGYDSLVRFLAGHGGDLGLTEEQGEKLIAGDITITYLRYDWKLNRVR